MTTTLKTQAHKFHFGISQIDFDYLQKNFLFFNDCAVTFKTENASQLPEVKVWYKTNKLMNERKFMACNFLFAAKNNSFVSSIV